MITHAFVAFLLLAAAAAPAAADAPVQELKTRVDRAVQILNDPNLKGPSHVAERRVQIRKIADEIFAFPEMATRALGVHAKDLPPAEHERFVQLFSDLLDRGYFEKIDSYNGEKVTYLDTQVEGDLAAVPTRMVTDKGKEILVAYRMMKAGGRWMVYDVIIEGVSLVQNYRAQFDRVIRTASVAELMKRLESQVAGQASPRSELKPRGAAHN
jgi:phospholipid transport system substrate-binding protein